MYRLCIIFRMKGCFFYLLYTRLLDLYTMPVLLLAESLAFMSGPVFLNHVPASCAWSHILQCREHLSHFSYSIAITARSGAL
ncbi:hypothetical protein LI328DRAFT_35463 [Trichoderma asperelloides]|nr:hypothetical protein LI328DRAFT_35463 [Trichoderma asperelloides]